jgi:hypothetical protein
MELARHVAAGDVAATAAAVCAGAVVTNKVL